MDLKLKRDQEIKIIEDARVLMLNNQNTYESFYKQKNLVSRDQFKRVFLKHVNKKTSTLSEVERRELCAEMMTAYYTIHSIVHIAFGNDANEKKKAAEKTNVLNFLDFKKVG